MEAFMEFLTKIFGEGADLAAVASTAGVGGGTIGLLVAVLFRNFFMKLLAQIITTGLLTGAGFLALLHFLGFELVAKEGTAAEQIFKQGQFQPNAFEDPVVEDEETGKTRIYYKSPWRRG